jgi:hypothetical protein
MIAGENPILRSFSTSLLSSRINIMLSFFTLPDREGETTLGMIAHLRVVQCLSAIKEFDMGKGYLEHLAMRSQESALVSHFAHSMMIFGECLPLYTGEGKS